MQNRWLILFVLFFARTAMAFQFQSVGALSPFIIDSLALSLVEIGFLIGLYLGPGIIVATLGGAVASWFGDKRTVGASLILMVLGSALIAYAPGLNWLIAGRVISGIGGVVVNVVMTKMVIDWFAGGSIATAMAVFISSWPLGIALSLLILPGLVGLGGLATAWMGVTIVTLVALVAFLAIYRAPPGDVAARGPVKMVALPMTPLFYAALVWGLLNTAIAMVFGFGPIVLTDKGLSPAAASSATSLYMLLLAIAVPLGGWVSDWMGWRDGFIALCLIVCAVLFPVILYAPVGYLPLLMGIGGFVLGLAGGPVVSLPSYVLAPDQRAFGMGVYLSVYYVLMMAAPPVAGTLAEGLDSVSFTFSLGALMLVVALLALIGFRRASGPAA